MKNGLIDMFDIETDDTPRTSTKIPGIDKVLGRNKVDNSAGFADGQIIMLHGDPGAGKSTLLLQIAQNLTVQRKTVLYVAGEEDVEQIKERADRIGGKFKRQYIRFMRNTDIDSILDAVEEMRPDVYIIDSIQKVKVDEYTPGSATALRRASQEFMQFSKDEKIAAFIVVHVSRDGDFSGPREVEHNVDTAISIKKYKYERVLHCSKNRMGDENLKAYFKMTDKGLVEVEEKKDEEETDEEPVEESK